jgi:cytochrome bd-type quinol oxidase subunit 2
MLEFTWFQNLIWISFFGLALAVWVGSAWLAFQNWREQKRSNQKVYPEAMRYLFGGTLIAGILVCCGLATIGFSMIPGGDEGLTAANTIPVLVLLTACLFVWYYSRNTWWDLLGAIAIAGLILAILIILIF